VVVKGVISYEDLLAKIKKTGKEASYCMFKFDNGLNKAMQVRSGEIVE
jgi:hypothetical protein